MSLSHIMNTYMTPQPPERGSLQTAVKIILLETEFMKLNSFTADIVRKQFPLPGGQGVREEK